MPGILAPPESNLINEARLGGSILDLQMNMCQLYEFTCLLLTDFSNVQELE